MSASIRRRAVTLVMAVLAVAVVTAAAAGTASAEVVYSNIQSPLPGDYASFGAAAYSFSEFGGAIQ